jgi:hypothetical protein
VLIKPSPAADRDTRFVSRGQFLAELRAACDGRSGYAAGKLGVSERAWLQYPIVLEQERDPRKRRAFELVLAHKSLKASGVFPAQPEFYRRWCGRYSRQVGALDSIGVVDEAVEETFALLDHHGIDRGGAIHYSNQQPDRSSPSVPERCYLDAFSGRHVLLICPFAEFLAARATPVIFERVWAKTGKRWFYPRSVQALEFPYGFSPATQSRYGSALDLLEELQNELARRTFDVALIAAGGLGIPLAAFVRRQDRVGISLGGHLQVLFGVLGERWRSKLSWQERYFNDSWVDLPQRHRPGPGESSENYW